LSLCELIGNKIFCMITFNTQTLYTKYFKGALLGLSISVIINLWIGIGAVLYGKPPKLKLMSTENCNYLNRTSSHLTSSFSLQTSQSTSNSFK